MTDNRTYHFQTEEEDEMTAWISVLVNSKEGALMKAFDDNGRHGPKVNQGFLELQQAIIRYVLRLPGNDRCADCCSQNGMLLLSLDFLLDCCNASLNGVDDGTASFVCPAAGISINTYPF